MSKKLLSTLIASLFAAVPAFAQSDDPMRVQGSATFGGIYNRQNADDTAKLEEYQDLGNGVLDILDGASAGVAAVGGVDVIVDAHVAACRRVLARAGVSPRPHTERWTSSIGPYALALARRGSTVPFMNSSTSAVELK